MPKAFPEPLRAQAGFREDQHLVIFRIGYTQDPEVWDMGALIGVGISLFLARCRRMPGLVGN